MTQVAIPCLKLDTTAEMCDKKTDFIQTHMLVIFGRGGLEFLTRDRHSRYTACSFFKALFLYVFSIL